MKLYNPSAQIFVPDGKSAEKALERVTHLGIGAHQDDLEFMAFHGILECFGSEMKWFGGVTCANGSGSPRAGAYQRFDDSQMIVARRAEQNNASIIGRYGVMIHLDYPSKAISSATDPSLKNDLKKFLPRYVRKWFIPIIRRTNTTRISGWPSRPCRPCANYRANNAQKKLLAVKSGVILIGCRIRTKY
jgi:hypothetical protein